MVSKFHALPYAVDLAGLELSRSEKSGLRSACPFILCGHSPIPHSVEDLYDSWSYKCLTRLLNATDNSN